MSAWKRIFVQMAPGALTSLDPTLVLVMLDISWWTLLMVLIHAVVSKYLLYIKDELLLSLPSDVDECAFGMHSCDDSTRADCINTDGSYECICKPGFIGNGELCTPFGIWRNATTCSSVAKAYIYTIPLAHARTVIGGGGRHYSLTTSSGLLDNNYLHCFQRN